MIVAQDLNPSSSVSTVMYWVPLRAEKRISIRTTGVIHRRSSSTAASTSLLGSDASRHQAEVSTTIGSSPRSSTASTDSLRFLAR